MSFFEEYEVEDAGICEEAVFLLNDDGEIVILAVPDDAEVDDDA